ncbi:MAG: hypothetical protein NUV73_04530 [Candidatus Daviesbacteria bacterium]|nr:hypothetical protein [Candidatus Daviesbacteria bacterium]
MSSNPDKPQFGVHTQLINPEPVVLIKQVVFDGEVFLTTDTQESNTLPPLEDLAKTPITDYVGISHLVKGKIKVGKRTVPITTDPLESYKVFIDAQPLTPNEIKNQKGLAEWMSEHSIKRVVRSRGGAIVELNPKDKIIYSQAPRPGTSD